MKPQKISSSITRLFRVLILTIAATAMLPGTARAAVSTWASNSDGTFNTAGNWSPSGLPGIGADLLFADITSGTGITRTASGDLATAFNSLTITQSTTPGSGTTNNQVKLTTQNLTLSGATPFTITGASATGLATLDVGGKNMILTNASAKSVSFGNYTVLTNTGGTPTTVAGGFNSTGGALTLNFNGGQLAGNPIFANASGAATTVNVTQSTGAGTMVFGANGGSVTSALNLNGTGSLALGSTFVNYSATSNQGASTTNGLAVTVANTMTGLSSGIVTTQLLANAATPLSALSGVTSVDAQRATTTGYLYNGGATSLTFTSGGTGFAVNGGIIDVRSTAAAQGVITTNGNNINISGGGLAGNKLVASSGNLTLSGGQLALRDTSGGVAATAVNYTVANVGDLSTNTIGMASGGSTGILSLSSSTTASTISISGLTADGGTWDRGTINADTNYTITNGFGSTFASFTVAANSGLNGLAMGTAGVPTLLTLGVNSSFYVASSTAAGARTYNVGPTGGSNNVITPAAGAGGFGFGINNSVAVQTINLNRDKGGDAISLLSLGNNSDAVNITANQTGAGNLKIRANNVKLNAGVTFGGTGGIDMAGPILSNAAGQINGLSATFDQGTTFSVEGTLNGTNTINLGLTYANTGSMVLASTASVGGVQNWIVNGSVNGNSLVFTNNMSTPANWSGSISLQVNSGGTIDASTSTTTPGSGSSYKFNAVTLAPSIYNNGAANSFYMLGNSTTIGTAPTTQKALYASTLTIGQSQTPPPLLQFDLGGESLYLDRFSNLVSAQSQNVILRNDALNTVSEFKAIGTVGDTLVNGGIMVLNGATLAVVGGNYNGEVASNNAGGGYAADTSAAPNASRSYGSELLTTQGFSGSATSVGSFTSFLGSGNDAGVGGVGTLKNTGGTFRVLGGNIVATGYLLNPVGVTGLIDTTGTSGATSSYGAITDTTLNNVTIRGNALQAATVASNVFTPTTKQIYANGDVVNFTGGFTGVTGSTNYYVVNSTGTTFQVSATQGGSALTGIGGSGNVTDIGGAGNANAYPGLIVGGNTTVTGNLVIGYAPGATNQATLRVGGDNATGYSTSTGPTAHSGTGLLIVTGDLTTQKVGATSVNVSIQSNGAVKVGGNVSIAGVGTNVAYVTNDITGMNGVGINTASNFTLNGNKGTGTPQTVNIVPTVGNFHVGDGSAGTLTGTAAQAQLAANLTATGSQVDVNGAASALNLGGQTLTVGTLVVGGKLSGNGTVTGNVTIISGGTLSPGNSAGLQVVSGALTLSGNVVMEIAGTARGVVGGYDAVNVGTSQLLTYGGTLTLSMTGVVANGPYNLFSFTSGSKTGDFSSLAFSGYYSSGTWSRNVDLWTSSLTQGQIFTFNQATGDLIAAVPEPATWALLAFGLTTVIVLRRRRCL